MREATKSLPRLRAIAKEIAAAARAPGHTQAKLRPGPNMAAPIPTKTVPGIKRQVPTVQEITSRAGPIRPASLMIFCSCSGLRYAFRGVNSTMPIATPAATSIRNALIRALLRTQFVILPGSDFELSISIKIPVTERGPN
jgi:hypothetical protein